ncbi:PREDICTED: uncharacterized protein LOC105461439 [Wasmannia auropunctata]|uniref:uncharacterized protein LOC105461439 n=1 Tax=Wasmannia auropunctata TaxID=64793 RepID=UPI0005EE8369|nr:PREDICTED: uncharacterized protein LOC105461439 [Wasmannia auropunctata]
MTCCVEGCNSRGGKKNSSKKSLFTPRTNDMFTSWYTIMCTKNIKINKNSRICELHFKAKDIIKEDAFVQTNGTVIYVPRKNPKLKEGAVPSIFPIIRKLSYFEQIEHNNSIHSLSVKEPILSTSHLIDVDMLQIEDGSFTPLKETVVKFSAKDINIGKNIEVPTSYWFANINLQTAHIGRAPTNRMMVRIWI